MRVWKKLSEWLLYRQQLIEIKSIALVPTMGCLHAGHGALIDEAKKKSDCVVLSIFVNPTQFNDISDLHAYPRTVDNDILFAKQLGVDHILLPEVGSMYPKGSVYSLETKHTMAQSMEGAARPGHFSGVLTVVMKLLNIVNPHQVIFGNKDFQQWHLVRDMIDDFFMPIEVVVVDTVRESFGLPISSRNGRLRKSDWPLLQKIYHCLSMAGELNHALVKHELEALGVSIDYLRYIHGRIFVAFYINNIRLIDNFIPGELSC